MANIFNLQLQRALDKSFVDINRHNTTGEVYLFIVGIDTYKSGEILNYCEQECNEFKEIFNSYIDIKQKNVYTLFNQQATKINILSHLDKFSKNLKSKDKLIIYFAGREHEDLNSNFFMPYDGDENNFSSWILSDTISKAVIAGSYESLLFFDLKNTHSKNVQFANDNQDEILLYNNADDLYSSIIKFFLKDSNSRTKQFFCFFRENYSINHEVLKYNLSSYRKILFFLQDEYLNLIKRVENRELMQVLIYLKNILQVNDLDLLSRVETLIYKLSELTTKTDEIGYSEEIAYETDVIEKITCDVIERINKQHFYLIKIPDSTNPFENDKEPKIKILFTSATPRDENFLRLKEEAKTIEYELMKAKLRDRFEFVRKDGLDIDSLQDALLNELPQFLHFCGHGSCDGIMLLNNMDEAKVVETKPLAGLLKLFSTSLQCVFLNSCHSIVQSVEISKHISNVICMKKEVSDNIAITFAAAFYKSIGSGKDIKFSFEFAKNAIELHGIEGNDIPTLLSLN